MKKLVTGATGFIGSAIARELLAEGQEVKVLARKTSSLENVRGLDVEVVYGDICDQASMKEALRGCDTLYFTAAKYSVPLFVQTRYTDQGERIWQSSNDGRRSASLR